MSRDQWLICREISKETPSPARPLHLSLPGHLSGSYVTAVKKVGELSFRALPHKLTTVRDW
jgi:hypothetical protein